jgi:hypothetical protein
MRLLPGLVLISVAIAGFALAQGQGSDRPNPPVLSPEFLSKISAFKSKMGRRWKPPAGSRGRETSVIIVLNRDGTLSKRPVLVEPATDQITRAMFDSAVTALERCQPYDMFPSAEYDLWKDINLLFVPVPERAPASRPKP